MATPTARFTITATDKTRAAFDSIRSGLGSVTSAVFSMRTALIGVAGIAGIGLLVKSSLEATDAIGKMSKTYGVATEDLAAFKLAADLGGSSLETFAKAARNLSKGVADFVQRGVGEAKDAFDALGISQEKLRPIQNDTVALFGLVADELNKLDSGAVKVSLAYKMLGGRSLELLPALEGGSASFEGFRKEATLFGLALSRDAVQGVEDANDAMTRLKSLFIGFRDQTVAALAPALEFAANSFKDFMLEVAEGKGGVRAFSQEFAKDILDGFEGIATGAVSLINLFREARAFFNAGEVRGKEKEIKRISDDIGNALKTGIAFDITLERPKIVGADDPWFEEQGQRIDKLRQQISDLAPETTELTGIKSFFDDLRQSIDDANNSTGDLGKTVKWIGSAATAGLEMSSKEVSDWTKEAQDDLRDLMKVEEDAREKSKELADSVKELWKNTRTPLENVNLKVAELNKWLEDGVINLELYRRGFDLALKDIPEEVEKISDAAKDLGYAFNSAFEEAVIGGGKLSDVLRGLALDVAKIALRESVTKPLGGFVSSLVGGFDLGSIFGFAHGGNHTGGLRIVGEQGPELEATGQSRIYSAQQTKEMLGGQSVSVTLNIQTGVSQTVRAEVMGMLPQITESIKGAVADSRQRGGKFSAAMGS